MSELVVVRYRSGRARRWVDASESQTGHILIQTLAEAHSSRIEMIHHHIRRGTNP